MAIRRVVLHSQELVELGVCGQQDLGWRQTVVLRRSFLILESGRQIANLFARLRLLATGCCRRSICECAPTHHVLVVEFFVLFQSLLDLFLLLSDRQTFFIFQFDILGALLGLALVLFLVLLFLALFPLGRGVVDRDKVGVLSTRPRVSA